MSSEVIEELFIIGGVENEVKIAAYEIARGIDVTSKCDLPRCDCFGKMSSDLSIGSFDDPREQRTKCGPTMAIL
jgi:hypothetical protein